MFRQLASFYYGNSLTKWARHWKDTNVRWWHTPYTFPRVGDWSDWRDGTDNIVIDIRAISSSRNWLQLRLSCRSTPTPDIAIGFIIFSFHLSQKLHGLMHVLDVSVGKVRLRISMTWSKRFTINDYTLLSVKTPCVLEGYRSNTHTIQYTTRPL